MNKIKKIKIGLGITVGLTTLAVLIGAAGAMFPPGFNNVIWPDKSRGYEAVSGYNSNFGEVGPFAQDEITVKFKGDAEPFRVIKITGGKVGEKIKEYSKRTDVVYAEPNYIAHALMAPNDTNYKYQWHLDNPVYGGIG
ncbi:MAG: hypothetical protein Q7J30_00750, partial [Candidatus Azambacteria bacterium]|nr:hypothetical protein [Candidatus Azambacteria bacterium]